MRKLIFAMGLVAFAAAIRAEPPVPKFQEVYELLRTNLNGVSDAELNRAAVAGLLEQLQPKVSLAGDSLSAAGQTNKASFRASVFENAYAYFRLGDLGSRSQQSFSEAYRQIARRLIA